MKIDGSCHCGRVTFTAVVDPSTVNICHCSDCQKLSGSPYRASIPAQAASFTIRGEPRRYVKTADSGQKRVQAFCPDCGSPIYSSAPKDPPVYNIRIGVIRQRAELTPARQIWCSSGLGWDQDISAVPKVNGQNS
jgi:hypothetical protein